MTIILLIIVTVLLNTIAQLLLKNGMNQIGHFTFTVHNLFTTALQVSINPFIISGTFLYVLSMAFWLLVLSRADVSYAYPMGSLAYILSAVAAYYLFDEQVTLARMVGILVIIAGVYLISRT